MPRAALASALLAAAVGLSACGGGGGGEGDEGGGEPPTQAEAYSEIVAEIAEQGSSPELALEAFTLVFGPIPGVEPPETSEGPGITSGTGAARLALRHFPEFTGEQRRAIESILIPSVRNDEGEGVKEGGGSPGASTPSVVLASVGASRFAQTPEELEEERERQVEGEVKVNEELTASARGIRDELVRRWGRPLPLAPLIGVDTPPLRAVAWAVPVIADPDTPTGYRLWHSGDPDRVEVCMLGLPPIGRGARGRDLRAVLAHEAFHCMQYELMGPEAASAAPHWITEGSAAWVGEAARGSASEGATTWWRSYGSTRWWRRYFEVRNDLLARSYDAIGFWAQLDGALDGSLWTALPGILEQPVDDNGIAAFRAALALDQTFPAAWAPQHARRSDFWPPDVWELDLHELRAPPELRAPVDEEDVARGFAEEGEWSETVPARTPWLYELTLPDPDEAETETLTLEVKGDGRGWWIDNPGATQRRGIGFDGDEVTSFRYCLAEREECARDDLGIPLPSETLMIGVVGLEEDAEIVVSLGEEVCREDETAVGQTPESAVKAWYTQCAPESYVALTNGVNYIGDCDEPDREGDGTGLGGVCSTREAELGEDTIELTIRVPGSPTPEMGDVAHVRVVNREEGWVLVSHEPGAAWHAEIARLRATLEMELDEAQECYAPPSYSELAPCLPLAQRELEQGRSDCRRRSPHDRARCIAEVRQTYRDDISGYEKRIRDIKESYGKLIQSASSLEPRRAPAPETGPAPESGPASPEDCPPGLEPVGVTGACGEPQPP